MRSLKDVERPDPSMARILSAPARSNGSARPKIPTRLPRHLGLIPDGNRRWAAARGLDKSEGYALGIEPGRRLMARCKRLGIEELSVYGFTAENTHRARAQVSAFRDACVRFAEVAIAGGAALQVIGNAHSAQFPTELRPLVDQRTRGTIKVNLLVNYSWTWDLTHATRAPSPRAHAAATLDRMGSRAASRIDLVIRWGGRSRLSGFLPVQSAYADVHVIDTLWPDMQLSELDAALAWYGRQDVTLGG